MSGELAIVNDVAASNLPRETKSAIAKWFDRATKGNLSQTIKKVGLDGAIHIQSTVSTVRQGSESALVGGLLALADTTVGLDVKNVPLDGAAALTAYAASAFFAKESFSEDLRNMGSAAVAICAFRKMSQYRNNQKKLKGEPVTGSFAGDNYGYDEADVGEDGEDPIISIARDL